MKNLILLALLVSPSLKAQINLDIFNSDAANSMSIPWRCTAEDYPGVDKLPDSASVVVKVRNNGKIKITPNIFKDKFQPRDVLTTLGINKTEEKPSSSIAIDYSDCVQNFYEQIKQKFAENTKNCATKKSSICDFDQAQFVGKVEEQIDDSDFAKKSKSARKLPRVLQINQDVAIDYTKFRGEISSFCQGKAYDKNVVLSGKTMQFIRDYNDVTSQEPGEECLNKLKEEMSAHMAGIEAEYCEFSKDVCDYLKAEEQKKVALIKNSIKKRAESVKAKEDIYRQKINPNWDAEFADSFDKMIKETKSDDCFKFTSQIPNTGGTKYARPTTMTNLVTKNMDQLFAKMDGQCQKTFIRQYLEENTFRSVIGDWTVEEHCRINKTPFCNETRAMVPNIEKNIERMLELAFGEYGKDYFREQILACEKNNVSALDDLLKKLKGFDEKMSCAPLNEGDGKVVSTTPTGLSAGYSLKKTGPSETTAYINMDFTALPGSTVSAQDMEKRVKECIKDVTPYMKGPGGKSLNIVIVNPSEAQQLDSKYRPSVIKISVGSTGDGRSNSGQYNPDSKCPTITHEVLHLFGLCDEYEEKWMGNYYDVATGVAIDKTLGAAQVAEGKSKWVNAYNCRNVPTLPSVMKSQEEVFSRAVPRKVTCECAGAACKTFMSSDKPELQNLFQNYGWNVVDLYYRTLFCSSKTKPAITKDQYLSNPTQFSLLDSGDAKVSYNFKYVDADQKVGSVDMSCDCNRPRTRVEANDIQTCKEVVADVTKKVADNSALDSTICPPGTVTSESSWGGDPKTVGAFNGKSYGRLQETRKPSLDSILWPSQFERITEGSCAEKAVLFSQCSKFAYKTAADEKSCNVPGECKDSNLLMGVQQ